jgi:hypothetical protein
MLLPLLCALQASAPDTLEIGSIDHPPLPGEPIDSGRLGLPQIEIRTRQGVARVWLLRAADTLFVAASLPDTSYYWGDDFVLSLDTRGDAAPNPQHDDFQWYFRRAVDSSVVFRGRNGRWEPPRADPDWRLGVARAGGGWEVSSESAPSGWNLLLRLDPAWLAVETGWRPRLSVRLYDDAPHAWYSWPPPPAGVQPTAVEQTPKLWLPLR